MKSVAIDELAASVVHAADAAREARFITAVIGAPGAGKSTLATSLIDAIETLSGERPAYLPMDGFHLDNAVLEQRGLLARKGASNTFDAAGYRAARTCCCRRSIANSISRGRARSSSAPFRASS